MNRDSFFTQCYRGNFIFTCYDRDKQRNVVTSTATGKKEYSSVDYVKQLIRGKQCQTTTTEN